MGRNQDLVIGLLAVFLCVVAFSSPVEGAEQDADKIGLAWKMSAGDPNVILKPGASVYISSNVFSDSFDGKYKIDREGFVKPKYFTKKVKIAGLNEVEASQKLLEEAKKQEVYAGSARLFVKDAARFEK